MRTRKRAKSGTTRRPINARKTAGATTPRRATPAEILGRAAQSTAAAGRVPAAWRWHFRVLLALQNRLLQERGECRQAAAEPLEPHSLDQADSATDAFDHDLALTELSADHEALVEVTEAIRRILQGGYGICEATGQPIPAARLQAVPWTRYTREVEERLELQGRRTQTRVGDTGTVRSAGRPWLENEDEETPPVQAKEEELAQVYSPPGRHLRRRLSSQTPTELSHRKGAKS